MVARPPLRDDPEPDMQPSCSLSNGSFARPEESPESPLAYLLTLFTLGTRRFFTVPQAYEVAITAFSAYKRSVGPGLRSCWSFWGLYEKPTLFVPTKEIITRYKEDVLSSNAVLVILAVMLGTRVKDVFKAAYEIDDFDAAIRQLVRSVIRNECALRTATQLLGSRQELSAAIRDTLVGECADWGVEVTRVELMDLHLASQGRVPHERTART